MYKEGVYARSRNVLFPIAHFGDKVTFCQASAIIVQPDAEETGSNTNDSLYKRSFNKRDARKFL